MIAAERVAAILLAGGLSSRFGDEDKLSARLDGRPLVAHAGALLTGLGFGALIAVCRGGNEGESVSRELAGLGFEIVANAAPERGMGHSLALGARRAAARDVDAALLCLGDMPFITAGHLAALLAAFEGEAVPLVATENAGTGVRSPPILFGRRHFPLFAALDGDQGGRGLLHEAFIVKASEAILRDIDIAGDLR